ncbi:unnamed protein product [Gongylonema pulchrum]|uniref:Uncharacterized protein n=1 Tax=Gongylonema pulchrum TaxID=637853 RepID=A0A183DKL2_9BILA|nr:unnamed protein product [Gongylonema pulchrum]
MRLHRQKAVDVGNHGRGGGEAPVAPATAVAAQTCTATANTFDALNVEHFDALNESLLLGNILRLAGKLKMHCIAFVSFFSREFFRLISRFSIFIAPCSSRKLV